MAITSIQKNLLQQIFLQSVIDKALKYKKSNADFKDVYALAKGKVSNEIGIYAIDKLNEEINK